MAHRDVEIIEAKGRRLEAQTTLVASYLAMKMYFAEHGYYSQDPDVAFDKGRIFKSIIQVPMRQGSLQFNEEDFDPDKLNPTAQFSTCQSKSKCLHYIYALQNSCEHGGKFKVHPLSEKNLKDGLRVSLAHLQSKLSEVFLPCKKQRKGFNLVAIGNIINRPAMDILAIDENGPRDEKGQNPLILIEDSLLIEPIQAPEPLSRIFKLFKLLN